jgi:hypothetical protein
LLPQPAIREAYDELPGIPPLLLAAVAILAVLGGSVSAFLALWFIAALLYNFSILADRKFTYELRRRRIVFALVVYLSALFCWALPLSMLGTLLTQGFREYWFNVILALVLMLLVVSDQFLKALQEIRFERRWLSSGLRLLFIVYVVLLPFAGKRLFD